MFFGYPPLERESKLSPQELQSLRKEIRAEFPRDDLLYELHMVRALKYEMRRRAAKDSAAKGTAP